MKSDFIEFIGNARQRRSDKFRNQLYIFLVCLVLSIFIWSLVRLSKDYYYSVEYHLNFTGTPSHLRVAAVSDSLLILRIKLQGYDFFSEQFLFKHYRQHEVSLKNVKLRYHGDRASGYLLTGRIGKEIVTQSNFPGDVYFVIPDTLFFEFERDAEKRGTRSKP